MRKILFTEILSAFLILSLVGVFFGCVENCSENSAYGDEICALLLERDEAENAEEDFCSIQDAPSVVVSQPEYFAETGFICLHEFAQKSSAKKYLSAGLAKQNRARHFKPPFQILRQLRI